MRAETVAIGTELLLGEQVDGNSAEISARLAEIGVEVTRHTAVGDDLEAIVAALGEAAGRADVVVVTGGLGPTQDDLTRDAVARAAGVPLERRPDLADAVTAFFAERGRPMPPRNLVQADLPVGADPIAAVGTAPGFALDLGAARVYCLPGVPAEMRVMLERDVVPDLIARAGLAVTVSRLVRTAGIAESAVADACADVVERCAAAGAVSVAFLASRGETRVRLTARAADRDSALALLDPIVEQVTEALGAAVVGLDGEGVEHAVARQLRRLGWTLAVGESVTGGGVGARLVMVPGASAWFLGGVVAYATDAKARIAGVDPHLLARSGPVGEETAGALADGVRARFGADVGLAVVGVAGPDLQDGHPVGTCAVAVSLVDGTRTRALRLPGAGRVEVQQFAVSAALDYLRRRLAELAG